MSWRAEYLDTVEAEQLKRLGPRRPPMSELPLPMPLSPDVGEQADQPQQVEPLSPAPPSPTPIIRLHGMCVYCGNGPTQGSPATCWSHRGLDLMDPHYNPAILW